MVVKMIGKVYAREGMGREEFVNYCSLPLNKLKIRRRVILALTL
jgi:hypothetical protein